MPRNHEIPCPAMLGLVTMLGLVNLNFPLLKLVHLSCTRVGAMLSPFGCALREINHVGAQIVPVAYSAFRALAHEGRHLMRG